MSPTTPSPSRSPDAGPSRTSYSLLNQPWLLARTSDGPREMGLMEVFEDAHEMVGLAGEIPTQEAACLRLLLAILYRAVDLDEDDPYATWRQWWNNGRLPVADVQDYLRRYGDRFDLLHPELPFLQVADLHTATGSTSGLGKIIAEIPDGHPFFTTRSGDGTTRLSYAEAARWLVHVHAYDYSGIKTGAVGDERVKSGKGYPLGTGFTGALGLLIAEGRTLAETLLLNLVLTRWRSDDRTPWESRPLSAGPDPTHTRPRGPADAATWESRRVRLIHDGHAVTDVVLAYGDPLGPQNRDHVEPMSSWRYSEPQSKKLGSTTYMPLEHQPSRSFWRGLASTMGARHTEAATKAGVNAFRPAELLPWLTQLRNHGALAGTYPVTLRAVGMSYGAQSASVASVIDDRLALPLDVIADAQVRQCAIDAADVAEQAVRVLGRLGSNLADAAGRHLLKGQADGARERALELGFGLLDTPYRRWVSTLGGSADLDERRIAWQRQTRRIIEQIGADLVTSSGMPAFVGRLVQDRHMNAPKAENSFRAALRKALPHAYDNPADATRHEEES